MFTPPNVSHVTCHMSRVTCHVSRVTCHLSHYNFFFFLDKVVKLIGGGCVINGAYPVQFVFLPYVHFLVTNQISLLCIVLVFFNQFQFVLTVLHELYNHPIVLQQFRQKGQDNVESSDMESESQGLSELSELR